MRIKKIEISNFRGHEQTVVEFDAVHALVGENGSGKTAILEAINFATSPYYLANRIDEQDFHSADNGNIQIKIEFDGIYINKVPDGYTHQYLPSSSIQLSVKRREKAAPGKALSDGFVISHLSEPITYQKPNELDGAMLPDSVTVADLPVSVTQTDQGYEIQRKSGKVMKVRPDSVSLNNDLVGFPAVFYFGRDREKEAKSGFNSLLTKINKDLNWRYRRSWNQDDAQDQWDAYYQPVIGSVEDKKKREIISPLRTQLQDLLGDDFRTLELSLLDVEQPFDKAFFALRTGTNQIDISNMGSGIAMILAYVLLEQISKLADERPIFLIDEPELHCHPQLQRKLADHFHLTQGQTIFSTHSPLLVSLDLWKGITRLDENRHTFPTEERLNETMGPQTIRQHLDDIGSWYYHETTFSDSDSDLFFARRVLLVEGPAEKYGLPRLARLLGKELLDLTIISCNGKNKIPHYAAVCRAYDVPTFVLFDLDGKPIDDNDNKPIAQATENLGSHHFTISFEDVLDVGKNAEHKSAVVLEKIDSMTKKEDVPEDLKKAINKISGWPHGDG